MSPRVRGAAKTKIAARARSAKSAKPARRRTHVEAAPRPARVEPAPRHARVEVARRRARVEPAPRPARVEPATKRSSTRRRVGARGPTIGYGVVGLGLMGRTHIQALEHARASGVDCGLIAVSDRTPARASGRSEASGNLRIEKRAERVFDPEHVRFSQDAAELFADPDVHAVSICTHTDTHVELALAALAAGKHVLVEKPVALAAKDIRRIAVAATKARRLAMPAMCMRFWPGWDWLAARVANRSLGAVRSAVFQRLASPPGWSRHFYADPKKSGGALVDLHIHDVDFVRMLFGDPSSVVATGDLDHVTALYRFARGPAHVVAEGGWDHSPGFAFRMRFVVVFERATADFDLARTPQLVLHRGGSSRAVAIADGDGYRGEMRHFLDALRRGATRIRPSMEDAARVAELLDAERAALRRRT